MPALVLVTAPAEEPITLAEAKLNLRVDHNDEDSRISALIAAARKAAENRSSTVLITQTLDYYLDRFPGWEIELPKGPLQSLTSITYIDADGVTQTLSSAEYLVDVAHERGRITPAFGKVWPATREQINAIIIRYQAGRATAAAVSEEIKQWMHLAIATWYENRAAILTGSAPAELPSDFFAHLLDAHKVWRFG